MIGIGINITIDCSGNVQVNQSSFVVQMTGLENGEAGYDDHENIGYTVTPSDGTITQRWGSTFGGDEFGTGLNPTDYNSAAGETLYLQVTRNGETVTISARIEEDTTSTLDMNGASIQDMSGEDMLNMAA